MPTTNAGQSVESYLESLGANEGYGEELWRLYRANSQAVPPEWQTIFARLTGGTNGHAPAIANGALGANGNGHGTPGHANGASNGRVPAKPGVGLLAGDSVAPLRGAAARLASNMEVSLGVPTATSQRTLPVGRLEANRRLLNQHLAGRGQKVSMTPILAWALVRALGEFPALNSAYTEAEGKPARVERAHVHLGLAVDVERAGGRSLLVPVVKQADTMDFQTFFQECDRLIRAARSGKISPDDLTGASISLTNPGTIGTRASVPRLMAGQGAIVAAGAIGYPAGFESVPEATLRVLGISKSFTLTCTYDHRVVQGAESGAFLARMHALLDGKDGFYEHIFSDLGVEAAPVAELAPAAIAAAEGGDPELARKQAGVFQLVHMYRVRGHLQAAVDPLEMRPAGACPELQIENFGLTAADLDRRFLCPLAGHPNGFECTLREMLASLKATYSGDLALEYMHLQRPEERRWLQENMEPFEGRYPRSTEAQLRTLRKLTEAEEFEHLLQARFVGHKRFSIEGGEALLPALDHLLTLAVGDGAQEAVLGMSHRGRLNVLVNILGVGMAEMFSKFEDQDPNSVDGSGDVKYHLGASGEHAAPDGRKLTIEMIDNPSHLEAVDPVVEGSTRARQDLRGDTLRQLVLPLLIHGDAAFAGQGVVAETLNLSQLGGYRTGGTVHLVVNNQIGFTTSPEGARSSLYSTDIARTVQAPIFHVNGDHPESVLRATELAYQFRHQFGKDVVVDIVCYRRHGHNEADDPSLTSPVLYRKIDSHPSVRVLYQKALVEQGVFPSGEEAERQRQAVKDQLSDAAGASYAAAAPEPEIEPLIASRDTGVESGHLLAIGASLCRLPEGFHLHPKLRSFLQRREKALAGESGIDWSLAEALALGSLATEGVPVRMAGQDTGRGTFSQRHAVLYDYENGAPYVALAHLEPGQKPVEVYDSLLSEEAALGFEYGYALSHPTALVLWEAQFGDFANGAQVIIDQFLSASQKKWGRTCRLTLLLPHGYEGQGPEHSSARMERFLQLSADQNWRVANCTTAGQYFHLLRSQGLEIHRPLVIFTPKSLLRNPVVATPLEGLTRGRFETVLPDAEARPEQVHRVLLCSGKVYYDLLKARQTKDVRDAAIVRVEQLYPFPAKAVAAEIKRYPKAQGIRWVQEEPENMGAWTFAEPRLRALVPAGVSVDRVSRRASSSPATGSLRHHQQEQAALLEEAFAG